MNEINNVYFERLTYHKILPTSEKIADKFTSFFKQAFEAISTFFFRLVYALTTCRFETNASLANRLVARMEPADSVTFAKVNQLFHHVVHDALIDTCEEFIEGAEAQLEILEDPLERRMVLQTLHEAYIQAGRQEESPLQEKVDVIPIPSGSTFLEAFLLAGKQNKYSEQLYIGFAGIFGADFTRPGLLVEIEGEKHELCDPDTPFPMNRVVALLSHWVEQDASLIEEQIQLPQYQEFMNFFKEENESELEAVKRFYRERIPLKGDIQQKLEQMLEDAAPIDTLLQPEIEKAIAMKLIDFLILFTQTLAAEPSIRAIQDPLSVHAGLGYTLNGNKRLISFVDDQLDHFTLTMEYLHRSPGEPDHYFETTVLDVPSLRRGKEYTITVGRNYRFP
jgi:hypothetical protein